MDPSWDDFKILLALARAGSVAGAGRALEIDHSTVSRRLSALEDGLGARLVRRGGREFGLTAEGRAALATAEAIEAKVAEAVRTIRATRLEVVGAVVVTCPGGIVPAMTRVLPAISDKHPSLAIQLAADNRTVDLARGDADIAIRMFRPTESGLVARRTFELGWGAYASQAYVAKHGTPATIAALAEHQLVLYVEAMQKVPGPRWIEEHRGAATRLTRVDNTEVASHVISAGGGIGVIPCVLADDRPELVRVFPDPVVTHTGWLVYHESLRDTARVRAAIDALVELFETNAAVFAGVAARRGSL
jgi:DNA-binding transcriptional LysR family regulator